ncbi:ABC1 kinase family protein [Ktedonosporobacter rubrisoli]|nr:AarF/UbiB family protein [Ktedonosporobacter rubrisoli]
MYDITLSAFTPILAIIILIFLGGRLLGLRITFLRGLLTAVFGLSCGTALAMIGFRAGNGLSATITSLGFLIFPLLTTMAFMVLGELLIRPGSLIHLQGQLMKPPHPLRAIKLRFARMRRYMQIASIIARNGLSSYFSSSTPTQPVRTSKLAVSFRKTLQEAGGVFVKMGQVLSTRPDLLPAEMIKELSQLQDRVEPASHGQIMQLLEEELGPMLQSSIAHIDSDPMAAASIAQVYHAKLSSGEQVVLKVQRPGIQTLVERDIDILFQVAQTLEVRTSWGRQMHVSELAHGFAENLEEELDFRVEARNLKAMADALKDMPEIVVPRVYTELSTERTLAMEWLDGLNIRKADQLIEELGVERKALARTLLECFLRQVLQHGIFHADPHPGNILILRTGKLGLIDLGSVGRLDPLQQSALRSMLFAIQLKESRILTQALLDITEAPINLDEERLERALAQFLVQRLGAHMPLDARVFTALFELLQQYQLAFPPVVAGVFRSLVTLEGTLTLLDPSFSLVEEAMKLAPQFLQEEIKPASLTRQLMSEIFFLLPTLHRLPRRLDRITAALEKGTLTTRTRLFGHEEELVFVRSLVSNLVQAFLSATLGIVGIFLFKMQGGVSNLFGVSLFQVLGGICMFVGAILLMRVIAITARDQVSQRKD